MPATSVMMCDSTLRSCPVVCSGVPGPKGRRTAPISRFRLAKREPAEGIATELDLKVDPELREAHTAQEAPTRPTSNEGISGAPKGLMQHGLDGIGVLAGNLLMNAASWRVVRGQTYCVHCRGSGREICGSCQGSGILEPEKVRMNQIRHAAGKLQVLLGVNSPKMFDSDWMKSNRCRRCHGTGAVSCKHCNGAGVRGPSA